ncbi:MAG: proprotein convertase P-domain-containing protein, partial [Bacteroidota bacterium]
FHGRSIEEITTFLEVNGGGGCATIINTSLSNPMLAGDTEFTIPPGTPLQLRASGSGDGNLTYTWEQYDVEQGPMPPTGTSVQGPLFRSFSPSPDSFRYLPILPAVMGGFSPVWEELPTISRDLDFRLTTRNTNAAYGCASELDVTLTVDDTNGPFTVTDPANGNQWSAGQTAQIQWAIAGTDAPAFDSPTVDILLSTDNGNTFTTLATAVPNTGYAEVTAPMELTTNARIFVRSTDNVFYNVSPLAFSINSDAGTPEVSLTALSSTTITDCFTDLDAVTFSFLVNSISGASEQLSVAIAGLPAGLSTSVSPPMVRPGGRFTLTVSGLTGLDQGTYNSTITTSSSEATANINISLEKLAEGAGPGPNLVAPLTVSTTTRPTLITQPNGMERYEFELSDVADFSNILYSGNTADTTFSLPGYLNPMQTYFWRVRSRQESSSCAISRWTTASFLSGPCFQFSSNTPPQTISSGNPPQVASIDLNIPISGTVLDLDVVGLDINHTYVNDLQIDLASPLGTEARLFDRECGSNNDIFLNLDDEGDDLDLPCPPVAPGLFLVSGEDQLSTFDDEPVNGDWTLTVTDLANRDGGTLNGFSLVVCLENFTLPVTFHSFTAEGRTKDILLTWITEEETNNAGFYVERTPN